MPDNLSAKPSPLLTLSVVSHGHAGEVDGLISSLVKFEETARIQLIVTDNLGGDIADPLASGWGTLTVVRNRRPQGFARNHNAAFRLARGRYFCLINPDVVLLESVFAPLIRRLEEDEKRIVAPLVVDPEGLLQDSFRSLPTPLQLLRRGRLRHLPAPVIPAAARLIMPDWIAGIFLLMSSKVFAELGGLDEGYRLYFEDVDFCTRGRLRGYIPVVDMQVRVQHDARRLSRRDFGHLFWHLKSALRFFRSRNYRLARELRTPAPR